LHLGFASHNTHAGANSQAVGERDGCPRDGCSQGFPEHLDRLDGVGQSFQGQAPVCFELVTGTTPGRESHPLRRQDLPALAGGTEPGRFNHRVPEVVVVLSTDFTAAQSDPQAHRLLTAPVGAFDALLHGHATRQGSRGRAENHHESVTQVLYLGAPGFGDGLAQDGEVSPADIVGGVGRQALRQFRRAHHVCEQDGHVLGGHRRATPASTPLP